MSSVLNVSFARMRLLFITLAVSCTSLGACSTQAWLDIAYTQTTQFCSEIQDSEARRKCMSTPQKSYDTYTTERETLKNGGTVPPRTNPPPP